MASGHAGAGPVGARLVEIVRRPRRRVAGRIPRRRSGRGRPRLGPEREREDDAPLDPRRTRRADAWLRVDRGPRDLPPPGIGAVEGPVARDRLRIPDAQPDRRSDRRRERRAAAAPRATTRGRASRRPARCVRPRAPRDPTAERDLRRRIAAGGRRPRTRERTEGAPGGRADRVARRERHRRGPGGVRPRADLVPCVDRPREPRPRGARRARGDVPPRVGSPLPRRLRAKPLSWPEFATRDGMRPMDDARQRMQRLVGRAWDEARSPLYRNAFFIMLASLIGSLLGFVFLYVVYQAYDLTDAGYAATMVNTVTFLVGIGSLGMPIALVRFLPESDDPSALVNTSLSISGVLSAALALAFVASLGFWSPNLLVVTAFATVLGGTLGVYMSWSLSFSISVIVVALVLLPRVIPGYRPRPRLSRRRLRPMFRFSVGNWLAGLIGSAGSLLLTLLIINTLPKATASTATAVYYAVTVMAGILTVIPQATMTSLYAEASQRNANRRRDERRAIALSIALLIPAIVGMWVFADILLRLFEKPTLADLGAQPLRILSLSSIPVFLNSVFGTRVRVRKEIIPLIVSAAIGSAVTLGFGYVLLESSGLVGLAIAVVIGQAAATPYLLVVAGRPMEEEPMLAPTPRP